MYVFKYMDLLAKNIFLVDIKIIQTSPQNHNCLSNTLKKIDEKHLRIFNFSTFFLM